MFPAKNGVSEFYSPHAIMTNKSLSYKDLKIPFGAYVQAYEDTQPHNSNKARMLDCLYFFPCKNKQKGHELMHIQTGKPIQRRDVRQVPMTQAVIDAVNALGKRQGMRKSFKIETLEDRKRNKQLLIPAHWIAGVEHDLYEPQAEDEDSSTDDETWSDSSTESDSSDEELSFDDENEENTNPINDAEDAQVETVDVGLTSKIPLGKSSSSKVSLLGAAAVMAV